MSDLIRRSDAIEEVARRDTTDGTVKVYSGREVIEILQEMPSAQPERKTGRWLRSGSDLFPFECDQCSETNERKTPWCPHCGCKMEVEHDECVKCGFYDADYGCTCSSVHKWYACPIENKKPENIQALKEYAEWSAKMEVEHE